MMKSLGMFCALSMIVFFTACKKDSSSSNNNNNPTTPTYFFKFKINGTEYSGTSVNGNQSAGDTTLNVACAFTYNGIISSMALFMGSYHGPKTYSDFYTEMLMGGQTGDNYSSMPQNPVTIKITQDSNNEVKGEFSGTLYKGTDTTGTKISVTDGSFYAKIVK